MHIIFIFFYGVADPWYSRTNSHRNGNDNFDAVDSDSSVMQKENAAVWNAK